MIDSLMGCPELIQSNSSYGVGAETVDDSMIAAAQSHSFAGSVSQNVAHHADLVRFAVKQNAKVDVFQARRKSWNRRLDLLKLGE